MKHKKSKKNKLEYNRLEYMIESGSIAFRCSGIDRDKELAAVIQNFLLDMSKEHKVFFYGYRLPCGNVSKIIDPDVIVEKAENMADPFHIFFYLSEAKLDIINTDYACETVLYFFEKDVKWNDFLVTSNMSNQMKTGKIPKLSAYFITADQGADYYFRCSRIYEKNVVQLLENMSKHGCEIARSSRSRFFLKKAVLLDKQW